MSNRIQGSMPQNTGSALRNPAGSLPMPLPKAVPQDTLCNNPPDSILKRSGLPTHRQLPSNRDMLIEGGKEIAIEAGKHLAGMAVRGLFEMVDGLAKIGRATSEGRRVAEQRAFIAGMVNTLHPALVDSRVTPDQAHQQALKGSELRGTLNEIFAYKPGAHSTKFAHLKRRAAQYERGMKQARKLLRNLDPSQRRAALDQLRGELTRANPRYAGWSDQQAALKEMLFLRVR